MTFLFSLFTALANIKAIADYVNQFAQSVTLWYLQRAQVETLTQISDAAALAARATTDQERYEAAKKWQEALSHPRLTQ